MNVNTEVKSPRRPCHKAGLLHQLDNRAEWVKAGATRLVLVTLGPCSSFVRVCSTSISMILYSVQISRHLDRKQNCVKKCKGLHCWMMILQVLTIKVSDRSVSLKGYQTLYNITSVFSALESLRLQSFYVHRNDRKINSQNMAFTLQCVHLIGQYTTCWMMLHCCQEMLSQVELSCCTAILFFFFLPGFSALAPLAHWRRNMATCQWDITFRTNYKEREMQWYGIKSVQGLWRLRLWRYNGRVSRVLNFCCGFITSASWNRPM